VVSVYSGLMEPTEGAPENPATAPEMQAAGETESPEVPWERPGSGVLGALWETLLLSLVKPGQLFRQMSPAAPAGRPAYRGVLHPLTYLCTLVLLMSVAVFLYMLSMGAGLLALTSVGRLVLYSAVLVFVHSLLAHLLLVVMRGARARFVTTFRVVCYSAGAQVLGLVPIFGGILVLGWGLALVSVGIVTHHRASWPKAIAAAAVPPVLMIVYFFVRSYLPFGYMPSFL
jgi:hypothetical protein